MTVDAEVIAALSKAIGALDRDPPAPIPVGAVAALAGIAKPGARLKIDLAATAAIGAPLVTVVQPDRPGDIFAALTARQREVAALIVEGRPNKAISAELGITLATVKDHVHAILQKLDLPSRAAVIAAARSG